MRLSSHVLRLRTARVPKTCGIASSLCEGLRRLPTVVSRKPQPVSFLPGECIMIAEKHKREGKSASFSLHPEQGSLVLRKGASMSRRQILTTDQTSQQELRAGPRVRDPCHPSLFPTCGLAVSSKLRCPAHSRGTQVGTTGLVEAPCWTGHSPRCDW